MWHTKEGVAQAQVQQVRPDENDEHEREGVDVAEEVQRRDARLRQLELHDGCCAKDVCGAWGSEHEATGLARGVQALLECGAGLVLGHEGDRGDGEDVVHEEGEARALVDLAREAHRDLLADEGREARLPESLGRVRVSGRVGIRVGAGVGGERMG